MQTIESMNYLLSESEVLKSLRENLSREHAENMHW